MSPKPTVENTVIVKYSAPVRSSIQRDEVVERNQQHARRERPDPGLHEIEAPGTAEARDGHGALAVRVAMPWMSRIASVSSSPARAAGRRGT